MGDFSNKSNFNMLSVMTRMMDLHKVFQRSNDSPNAVLSRKIMHEHAPEDEVERETFKLGLILYEQMGHNNVRLCEEYINEDFPINFQHPSHKNTALHLAASMDRNGSAWKLLESGKCDLLLKNSEGALAYDWAYRFSKDPDLIEAIRQETLKQAKEGIVRVKSIYDPDFERGYEETDTHELGLLNS